jgi:hypothetical protein
MSWLKENSFVAGLAATTTIVGGVLFFLMMQSMTRYHEALDTYAQVVQKLHGLQNRSPFPSAENFEKSRLLEEQYKSELASLRTQLEKMEAQVSPDVQPQKFQDDLRTAVNRIVERAAAAGVELPKSFYLGFSQYANSLPSKSAAPALARQLVIIEKIVTNLIDFKVQSIDSLNRPALPEESAVPASQKTEEPRQRGGQAETKTDGLRRLPFDLAFTAEQGKLRVAFNSLLDSDQFLIVRNLALQNTARIGPPVSGQSGALPRLPTPASPAPRTPGSATNEQSASGTPDELNVILGRERVKASMRIEIIDLPTPAEQKK